MGILLPVLLERQMRHIDYELLVAVKHQAWKKNLYFPAAGQNFPPAGQISLQCGMVSLMYFFIFSFQITKFPGKELPVLPVFSTPG